MMTETENKWMFRVLLLMALASNVSTGVMVGAIALGGLIVLAGVLRRRALPMADTGLAKAVLLYLIVWMVCAVGAREQMMSMHSVVGTSFSSSFMSGRKNKYDFSFLCLLFLCVSITSSLYGRLRCTERFGGVRRALFTVLLF